MTVDELLTRFDGARPRGAGKWSARCPAHADKTPSLSVCEGERAILLKCWAGCDVTAICAAIGLTVSNLFFDSSVDPREAKRQRAQRERERQQKARVRVVDGLTIDALREAESLVRSRHGLDISRWIHAQLEDELSALADAYNVLACEDLDGQQ